MELAILGFLLLLCIANLIRLFRQAKKKPIDLPAETIGTEDYEPVRYKDIMYSERPYVDHQYN
jgi:hypothetical protein